MSDYGISRLVELTVNGIGHQEEPKKTDIEEIIEILSSLAANLRDESVRVELQGSQLPECLFTILDGRGAKEHAGLAEQVGRVAANYGAENATNLDALVDAGYPQKVLRLLASAPPVLSFPAERALIASLLNAIMSDHEASKEIVAQPENLRMLLTIAEQFSPSANIPEDDDARATVAEWVWTVIESVTIHSPASLSAIADYGNMSGLLYPLEAFTPPHENVRESWWDSLLAILQHYCECLERLSELEISPNQPTLDHVVAFSEEQVISTILDFVERGTLPPDYDFSSEAEEEDESVIDTTSEGAKEEPGQSTVAKTIAQAKASVLKFVTSLCWEIPYNPASPIWLRIRNWLADEGMKDRDDLIGSAMICFANGVRNADTAIALLAGQDSLLPVIMPLLSPDTKVVLQHSVIGLVKNLANPPENKVILGEAGVIDRLIKMEVFSDKRDMVGTIQGGSAGLIKLLCSNNTKNSSDFVRHPEALDQVLAIIKRTDDPNIGYEATRIFINAIKSLSSDSQKYAEEIESLSRKEVISSLVDLLRRTWKWPILINDSIISLTLLVTFGPEGTAGVAGTILDELEEVHTAKEGEESSGVQVIQKITQSPAGDVSKEIKANTETLMAQLKERVGERRLEDFAA